MHATGITHVTRTRSRSIGQMKKITSQTIQDMTTIELFGVVAVAICDVDKKKFGQLRGVPRV